MQKKKAPHKKYRYLTGKAQRGQVKDIKPTSALKITRMIHGNGKYIAYQKQGGGGGSIEVFDDSLLMDLENDSVKMDTDNPKCIGGHKGGSDDF